MWVDRSINNRALRRCSIESWKALRQKQLLERKPGEDNLACWDRRNSRPLWWHAMISGYLLWRSTLARGNPNIICLSAVFRDMEKRKEEKAEERRKKNDGFVTARVRRRHERMGLAHKGPGRVALIEVVKRCENLGCCISSRHLFWPIEKRVARAALHTGRVFFKQRRTGIASS